MDSDEALFALTLAGVLGAALVAGVLFAFSSFVMPGLNRLQAREGILAMQAVNITAVTPAFMTAFIGTAGLSVVLGIWGAFQLEEPGGPWLLGGALAYLLGTFILTASYHVPRNNRLAELDAAVRESAAYWRVYQAEWTRMNHVRALASAASLGCWVAALVVM